MRRDGLVDVLVEEDADGGHVFPAYGDYCFERVAPTALSVLDAAPDGRTLPPDVFDGVDTADVDHVVLVLVDALGYDEWRRAERTTPLLAAVADAGTVTPLTTIFPSETAAAIPTLHTGVPPVEHGLLGWHQYVADLRAVVQALPWTTQDGEDVANVYDDPPLWNETFLGAEPLYERVDVHTRLLQPRDIAGSASGVALTRGADERFGYHNVADAAHTLRRALEASPAPSYTVVYVPDVDVLAHRDGPMGGGTTAQVESVAAAMERELCDRLALEVAERTLLVLTADHGQTDTAGENVDVRGYEPLWNGLARGPDGEPIPPVGSSRNLQLFLADGAVDTVRRAMERDFDCRTFARPEYEARDLFGRGQPSPVYERHAPDVVCVHRDRGMWYDDASLSTVGKHGGLTRAEMLVPFAAVRLDRLRSGVPCDAR